MIWTLRTRAKDFDILKMEWSGRADRIGSSDRITVLVRGTVSKTEISFRKLRFAQTQISFSLISLTNVDVNCVLAEKRMIFTYSIVILLVTSLVLISLRS